MNTIDIEDLAFEKSEEFLNEVRADDLPYNMREAERQSFICGFNKALEELGVGGLVSALVEARGYINTKRNIFKEQHPEDEPINANNKLKAIDTALKNAGFNV